MEQVKLNISPAPTFSWLQVNAALREQRSLAEGAAEIDAPAGISVRADGGAYRISGSAEPPVRVRIRETGAVTLAVHAAKDSALTVILDLTAEQMQLDLSVTAEANAKVRLVQLYRNTSARSMLAASLADCADLHLVQIYLHTPDTVSGTEIHLDGSRAVFTSDIGYLLDDDNRLDLNLNMKQRGRRSQTQTDVHGVLRGHADKVFRGTIDFLQGAAGASGAEREDVLLMDETVRNRTLPVILCAEEDVSGTHGASVGRLDAQHVFYLQSRGIPEEQITALMAQAKLGCVIRKIGDAETERLVNGLIGREETDD